MFQLGTRYTELVLDHRHSDGSWARLEQVPDDAADHDQERDWRNGVLYECTVCDERVRVSGPAGVHEDRRA